MTERFKQLFYFPIASYFRFFASIRLRRWNPRVIVVTGSNGKTTLFSLLESQLGDHAKFSHHANSSYGIPFDILDLHRKSLRSSEWVSLFLKTPFLVFKNPPKEQVYVVEADTDRPGEGKFLAEFLKPEVVLWTNVGRTHSMNFDRLVSTRHPEFSSGSQGIPKQVRNDKVDVNKKFASVEEAIAFDYGYFLEYCSKLVVVNGDITLVLKQTTRTKADVKSITKKDYLDNYVIKKDSTMFKLKDKQYSFPCLFPEEIFYSIAMCKEAVDYLNLPFDSSFSRFSLPPGRSSVLPGIKNTTIIDSSYNGNLGSTEAILSMFEKFPAEKKWVVLADMLELGDEEQEEHEALSDILARMKLERIILFGPRVGKYTYPKLKNEGKRVVEKFSGLKNVKDYILEDIKGREAILFKGSQSMMLEAVIEYLLENKEDIDKLPRREKIWKERRQGLINA